MYLATIILLMGVFPLVSIFIESVILHSTYDLLFLIGKWFVFWAVGVRLFLAGLRQIINPAFTAETIFDIKEKGVLPIVQELGFGNLAIGLVGLLSTIHNEWIIPAAITGGLYYGLAGIKHLLSRNRNSIRTIAMISDLCIFLLLAGYLVCRLF